MSQIYDQSFNKIVFHSENSFFNHQTLSFGGLWQQKFKLTLSGHDRLHEKLFYERFDKILRKTLDWFVHEVDLGEI